MQWRICWQKALLVTHDPNRCLWNEYPSIQDVSSWQRKTAAKISIITKNTEVSFLYLLVFLFHFIFPSLIFSYFILSSVPHLPFSKSFCHWIHPGCPSPTITKSIPPPRLRPATATVCFGCKTFHVAKVEVPGTFDSNLHINLPSHFLCVSCISLLFSSLLHLILFFSVFKFACLSAPPSCRQTLPELRADFTLPANLAFHRCKREPVQPISELTTETR